MRLSDSATTNKYPPPGRYVLRPVSKLTPPYFCHEIHITRALYQSIKLSIIWLLLSRSCREASNGEATRRRRLRQSWRSWKWRRSPASILPGYYPNCRWCWLDIWLAHTSAPKSSLCLYDRDLGRVGGKNNNRIANFEYTSERKIKKRKRGE